jgi:hypothetical protein
MSVTDSTPVKPPTAGVDWASDEHAVAIVDADGVQLDRFSVAHTAKGLLGLVRRLRRARGSGDWVDRSRSCRQ